VSGGVLSSGSDDDGGGFSARCASSSKMARARRIEPRNAHEPRLLRDHLNIAECAQQRDVLTSQLQGSWTGLRKQILECERATGVPQIPARQPGAAARADPKTSQIPICSGYSTGLTSRTRSEHRASEISISSRAVEAVSLSIGTNLGDLAAMPYQETASAGELIGLAW
jgi:hypothetical protein